MKLAPSKKKFATITLQEIDWLVGEIADYRLTRDGLQEDIDAKFRDLETALQAVRAEAMPAIERLQATKAKIERSLDDRLQVVEGWAIAHKGKYFAERRSIKLLRGVIGFRLTPGKVVALAGYTLASCALRLKRCAWGRDFLHAPKIDQESILKARASLEAKGRLASVGLRISQEDRFYVDLTTEGSEAFAGEAA